MYKGNPDSGIREIFVLESGHYRSNYRLESGIAVPLTKNPECSRNPQRRIQNPRIFRISLHGVASINCVVNKKARVYICRNQFESRVLMLVFALQVCRKAVLGVFIEVTHPFTLSFVF